MRQRFADVLASRAPAISCWFQPLLCEFGRNPPRILSVFTLYIVSLIRRIHKMYTILQTPTLILAAPLAPMILAGNTAAGIKEYDLGRCKETSRWIDQNPVPKFIGRIPFVGSPPTLHPLSSKVHWPIENRPGTLEISVDGNFWGIHLLRRSLRIRGRGKLVLDTLTSLSLELDCAVRALETPLTGETKGFGAFLSTCWRGVAEKMEVERRISVPAAANC